MAFLTFNECMHFMIAVFTWDKLGYKRAVQERKTTGQLFLSRSVVTSAELLNSNP